MSDDDLDRLLHAAVHDVHPTRGLAELRNRIDQDPEDTEVSTMNRHRWIPVSLAAAAAVALVVGGTVLLTDRGEDPGTAGQPTVSQSPTPTATPTPSPSETPSSSPATQEAMPLYFVGDASKGPRLFREFQRISCTGDGCLERSALTAALQGRAQDPDYRSSWPAGTTVADVSAAADQITVSLGPAAALHDRPVQMSEQQASLAIQQLLYTVQAGVGRGRLPVQLLLDGTRSDTVLGVPTSEPLAVGDPLDVLATVSISSPSEGATVTSPFTVSGVAATFEANVPWELRQGSTVVAQGAATAAECCKHSPYSFTVTAPPGTYVLVVHDDDPSGQGRPVTQDTRTVTIR